MAIAKKTIQFVGRPVWAEISLSALAANLRAIRKHIGAQRKVLAVVKANAYGHGAVTVAKTLRKAGADWLGVTCAAEGIELRESGVTGPILILSGFWPGEERSIVEHRLTPGITRIEQLRLLDRAAARARGKGHRAAAFPFHLKIDTGMTRLGIPFEEIDRFAAELANCQHLRQAGAFTHFAASEDFSVEQTAQQEQLFTRALARLRELGIDPGVVHASNSAAIVLRPSAWYDMVRPGALLYGYHQFYEPASREEEARRTLPLEPALSLRARIISLKEVPAGQGIGYNSRFVTQRPSRIAVIPAGYADCIVRTLSNRGRVLVGGRCAPIAGTVSMDLTMLDVTDIPKVQVGDVVTIFGASPDCKCQPIYANDVARMLGTVTSDLLCSVGRRVPRLYQQ